MLKPEDAKYLVESAKKLRGNVVGTSAQTNEFDERMARMEVDVEKHLELLIHCPRCKEQHIDKGRFATHPHNIHACQSCGLGFVVSTLPSIGVQFFDGWKNPPEET